MNVKRMIAKPAKNEYPEYAEMYIKLLPDDGMLLKHLQNNLRKTKKFIESIPESKLTWRYQENKWTIKEILVHITDDERIYAYRALRFARNDQTELPGFDQDEFTNHSGANTREMSNIMEEYEAVRKATIALYNGLDEEALSRTGIANNNHATVRALGYHIAGHEVHHINIIKERYLSE